MRRLRAVRLDSAAAAAACVLLLGVAEARPNPMAQTVSAWLLQYHAGDRDPEGARYAVSYVDLDADKIDEAVVYYESRDRCGTGGCNMYVLASRGGYWRRVSGHTVVNRPIRLLPGRHHGWHDLAVWVRGGGAGPAYAAALPFDGETYPLNPSVLPARRLADDEPGQVLISRETPLVPVER